MTWGLPDRLRTHERHPVMAGVVARVLTGLAGLAVTLPFSDPNGWFLGAIGCGVTVGALSESRLATTLLYAAIADLVSWVVAFFLFLVGYLAALGLSGKAETDSVVAFGAWYVSSGGGLVVPIAALSLGVTLAFTVLTAIDTGDERVE